MITYKLILEYKIILNTSSIVTRVPNNVGQHIETNIALRYILEKVVLTFNASIK